MERAVLEILATVTTGARDRHALQLHRRVDERNENLRVAQREAAGNGAARVDVLLVVVETERGPASWQLVRKNRRNDAEGPVRNPGPEVRSSRRVAKAPYGIVRVDRLRGDSVGNRLFRGHVEADGNRLFQLLG